METKQRTQYLIIILISLSHCLNDLLQGVLPSIYPALQSKFALSMAQIGLITFCYQIAASILQPIVGAYTDKHPKPYAQVVGMGFSALGIGLLSWVDSYTLVLCSVVFVGIGSSIFHPEASRISFLASGGKRSFAQAVFQLGGNAGAALAPLLVIWIIFSISTRSGKSVGLYILSTSPFFLCSRRKACRGEPLRTPTMVCSLPYDCHCHTILYRHLA